MPLKTNREKSKSEDKNKIIRMDGEPGYKDREGAVEFIGAIGQLHGLLQVQRAVLVH